MRELKSLQYSRSPNRSVVKRASPGERVLGSLFPNRGVGFPGGWTENLLECVQHMKNWTYVAIHCIASKIASITPNLAYVVDSPKLGVTTKAHSRLGAPLDFGQEWTVSDGGHSWMTVGALRSKALSVIKPHEELEPLENEHHLRRLIENPNPVDTQFDLWYELQMFEELCGVSYLWTVLNDYGVPCELWVIPSHWVWPRTGGGGYVMPDNPHADELIQYYEIRPYGVMGSAGAMRLKPNEVIMMRWKSPLNKIAGYSRLGAIAQWIDSEESISKSRWSQFQNQARPEFWVELGPGYEDPDDDRIARIEAKFAAKIQGEYNYGKPVITPPGARITPLSFSPTEMAYFQCLDEDTECLTKGGWKRHDALTLEDEIGCWDATNFAVRYAKPSAVHVIDYDGQMHLWENEAVSALMTPNHRTYTYMTWENTVGQSVAGTTAIRRADAIGADETFRVRVFGEDLETPSVPMRLVTPADRSVVKYKGKVWCVTVPTGLFVVRRNGKVHVTGNSEDQIRDMILSAFQVPKSAVGISNDMTYGSLLASFAQLCSHCLNPRLAMRGQAMTKHLASRWDERGRKVKLWWDDCVPADPTQVNADMSTDNQFSALTPNEVRAIRGRKPYRRGGDDPLVMGPAGMMPLPLNSGADGPDLAKLMSAYLTTAQPKPPEPPPGVGGPGAPGGEPSEGGGSPLAGLLGDAGAGGEEGATPAPGSDVAAQHNPTADLGVHHPNGPPSKSLKKEVRKSRKPKAGSVEARLVEAVENSIDRDVCGPDYQRLFWNPETKTAWWESADGDEEDAVRTIVSALEDVKGVEGVRAEAEASPPDVGEGWVMIYPEVLEWSKASSREVRKVPDSKHRFVPAGGYANEILDTHSGEIMNEGSIHGSHGAELSDAGSRAGVLAARLNKNGTVSPVHDVDDDLPDDEEFPEKEFEKGPYKTSHDAYDNYNDALVEYVNRPAADLHPVVDGEKLYADMESNAAATQHGDLDPKGVVFGRDDPPRKAMGPGSHRSGGFHQPPVPIDRSTPLGSNDVDGDHQDANGRLHNLPPGPEVMYGPEFDGGEDDPPYPPGGPGEMDYEPPKKAMSARMTHEDDDEDIHHVVSTENVTPGDREVRVDGYRTGQRSPSDKQAMDEARRAGYRDAPAPKLTKPKAVDPKRARDDALAEWDDFVWNDHPVESDVAEEEAFDKHEADVVSSEGRYRDSLRKSAPHAKKSGPHTYGCLLIPFSSGEGRALRKLADGIEKRDLDGDGRETDFHLTIKYGLHTKDAHDVRAVVAGFGPLTLRLGSTSVFEPSESSDGCDVVKVDVEGPDIYRLNALVSGSLECTDKHPVYRPHVTLAYVKAGRGALYEDDDSAKGVEVTVDSVTFANADGKETKIDLRSYSGTVEKAASGGKEPPERKVRRPRLGQQVNSDVLLAEGRSSGINRGESYEPSQALVSNDVDCDSVPLTDIKDDSGQSYGAQDPPHPEGPRRKGIEKGAGEPCQPGERSDLTDCLPIARPAPKPVAPLAKRDVVGRTAESAKADAKKLVKKVKEFAAKADAVKSKASAAVYEALPTPLKWFCDFGSYLEHKAVAFFDGGQEYAKAVAAQRGLPPEHVERVGKVLGRIDAVARWTENVPGLHEILHHAAHIGGPVGFLAAKLGFYVPVASLTYVAYSLSREMMGGNPVKLIVLAREKAKAAFDEKKRRAKGEGKIEGGDTTRETGGGH